MGPTGVGKTEFAEQLGRTIRIEIINGDMGQLYTPLTIGTAKPDWKNSTIPHHLFDYLDQPRSCSAMEYCSMLSTIMQEIWARNNLPVIVGGSSFYMRSIFFPPHHAVSNGHLPTELTAKDTQSLWHHLMQIDPVRAQHVHPHDRYRIMRALDIWYQHGVLPSEQRPRCQVPAPALVIFLHRDRAELYQRINARVESTMRAGWLNEVKNLSSAWQQFVVDKKIIGYPDIINYLAYSDQEVHYEQLVTTIQQKTRNYAKRQLTFWRSLRRDLLACGDKITLEEPTLTLLDLNLYIKQLSRIIRSLREQTS